MNAYLSSGIGLAGTAVGGLIGFLSARWIAERSNKRAAGAKLRAAFAPELSLVRATPQGKWTSLEHIVNKREGDNLDSILRRAFERHATAIEEHRVYVRPKDREAYQQAWESYYLVNGSVFFLDYMMNAEGHKQFCDRVEAIFRYTLV